MNAILYYSNTGESLKIAAYAAKFLNLKAVDMQKYNGEAYESAVLVFPCHCQNIPIAVRPILKNLKAKNAIILVCYGKMSYGNILYECVKKYKINVVGAAYIPAKHSYLPEDISFKKTEKLNPVLEKIYNPTTVSIPKAFKNPLADIFPGFRSRIGIKLIRGRECIHCGLCKNICENKRCIRCLKCVKHCPQKALSFRKGVFMNWYLKKKPKNELLLYK